MGYYNNKGQRDGSRGKYDPPNGFMNEFLGGWSSSSSKKMRRENSEYNSGHRNGRRGR